MSIDPHAHWGAYLETPDDGHKDEIIEGELSEVVDPDIIFIRKGSSAVVGELAIEGTPDLIVENPVAQSTG